MKVKTFLFLLLFISLLSQAQSTIESIPNQKLINGSYVSNPDNILNEVTVSQIDSILSSLEKSTTVQVAVVAVNSIGESDIFEFAQQLFNTWGIGQRTNNNGLLILLVKDSHTIRFHTGDGIESTLPDATCKRIQREFMVPEFKNENYDGGMFAGVIEVNKILTNPSYAEELAASESDGNVLSDYAAYIIFMSFFLIPVFLVIFFIHNGNGQFSNSKKPKYTLYPEMRMTRSTWVLLYGGIPAVILILFGFMGGSAGIGFSFITLYLYYLATVFYRLARMMRVINRFKQNADYYQIVEFLRSSQGYWFFMGLVFPVPFAFYFFYHLARKRIYRNHPRKCSACQGDMKKLDEKQDDAFLSKAQVLEEDLKSIDYDVWQCEKCSATEEWNYPNRRSKYKECPSCKTHAYYFVSRKTITSATYSRSGKGEEVHACKFCGKTNKSSYTIPMLVASTSSSSGSSFSSSSSSSGGSWGGGSSSGGGASSSW